jgi:hypothetical protein
LSARALTSEVGGQRALRRLLLGSQHLEGHEERFATI